MALHRNLTVHCVKCVFTKRSNKLKPAGKQQEYESLVAVENVFGNKHALDEDLQYTMEPYSRWKILYC